MWLVSNMDMRPGRTQISSEPGAAKRLVQAGSTEKRHSNRAILVLARRQFAIARLACESLGEARTLKLEP
jgi:hypothetical protein